MAGFYLNNEAMMRAPMCEKLQDDDSQLLNDLLTDREIELINGMIEVQQNHAARCDAIQNRKMAVKQKGWDLERVALLEKVLRVMGGC